MKEIVHRRYSRIKEEGGSFPDLLLADGGLTQVHACLEAFEEAGVDFPVFGLYKNDKHQTEGLIDKDGNTYPLDSKSKLFFLLMRMQDEVHRFAIEYHRSLRTKEQVHSVLDDIPGVGPKRRRDLMRGFVSLNDIREADVETLMEKGKLPKRVAEDIYAWFRREKEN
jgi:excinuclease ABC subunit C